MSGFQKFNLKIVSPAKLAAIYLAATSINFIITAVGFTEVNVVVIYILSVLLTSFVTQGYLYGILSAVICTLSFNFFFSDPLFSFNVYDTSYIFTFIVMLASAILTSTLTSRLLGTTKLANDREKQAHDLYAITAKLSQEHDIGQIVYTAIRELTAHLSHDFTCYLSDEYEQSFRRISGEGIQNIPKEEFPDFTSINAYQSMQISSDLLVTIWVSPLLAQTASRSYLDSVLIQMKIALERESANRQREVARLQVKQEQLKSSLLRAISHDLRTPLAGISGFAEILLQRMTDQYDLELAESIFKDSRWLAQLVENILNLTRLQENRLDATIREEAVEEVISAAVSHLQRYDPAHDIQIRIPEALVLVPMDMRLIQQVLINLLDNAVKHTPGGRVILLSVKEEVDKVWFSVKDEGSGIKKEYLPKLFDLFFTEKASRADSRRGIGLGLSICKAIIEYHGGEIFARNGERTGAEFFFYLKKEKQG